MHFQGEETLLVAFLYVSQIIVRVQAIEDPHNQIIVRVRTCGPSRDRHLCVNGVLLPPFLLAMRVCEVKGLFLLFNELGLYVGFLLRPCTIFIMPASSVVQTQAMHTAVQRSSALSHGQ